MILQVDDETITAVQLAAQVAGYQNLDLERFPNKVTIEATGKGKEPLKVTGTDLADACAKFVRAVT